MKIVKRIDGVEVTFGEEAPIGWLPNPSATPLPTDIAEATLDLTIEEAGGGYILAWADRGNRGSPLSGDTWYPCLTDAEDAAADLFGVKAADWEDEG